MEKIDMKESLAPGNAAQEWPKEGLESPGQCPVCGGQTPSLLHDGMQDHLFHAPGTWRLSRCGDCGAAWLDPRPTPATIGMAYQQYFTHAGETHEHVRSMSPQRRLFLHTATLAASPAWRFLIRPAIRFASILPGLGRLIQAELRYHPRPEPRQRLLDFGCGNGEFLLFARAVGWQVVGIDADAEAVATARSRGLTVRQGGIEALEHNLGRFDGITLSHVIEHVHEPVELLRRCHDLLSPGGWLWLETPNLDSQGHLRYGANWRGLEPPRHLVLFTRESLSLALRKAGFVEPPEEMPWRPLCRPIWRMSECLTDSEDQNLKRHIAEAERRARIDPKVREFISWRVRKSTG
jgi:SAM-dependent methyltransferase